MLKFGSNMLYISLFALVGLVSEGSSEKQTCRQSGLTLQCNYIRKEIPENITAVRIADWFTNINSEGTPSERICNERTFQSETWKRVSILEINELQTDDSNISAIQLQSKCFFPLKELQELHLHLLHFILSENAFVGLDKLQLLNFNGCSMPRMDPLNKALRGPNKVPNLAEIVLTNAGDSTTQFLQLDEVFVDALTDKPVKKIDVSYTQITVLNITDICKRLKYLEYFNVSNAKIGRTYAKDLEHTNVSCQLKTIDISYATLPYGLYNLLPGVAFSYNKLKRRSLMNILLSTKTLNLTGFIPDLTKLWFENLTVYVNNAHQWKVEEIVLNKNRIRRLNCTPGSYSLPTLTRLSFADNKMEFIHPRLLETVLNLQILDLSGNELYKMEKESVHLFENLLKSNKRLKVINFSNNRLNRIPTKLFEGNMCLEIIDLSNNNLELVTFDLQTRKHQQVLNFRKNKIARLDQDSMNNLNKPLILMHGDHSAKLMINLNANPIACAECEDQDFIDWVLRTIKMNSTKQNMRCQQLNGLQEMINEGTSRKLQRLCQRRVIVRVSLTTAGLLLLVIITLSIIIYKSRKIQKHRMNREAILNRLRAGKNAYEFVVFLSYSSDDEHFVNSYVINKMNETLQQITGINRSLICTGDKYFRPGYMVHDEIATCLERVCVMVVLVSDSYCSSIYCRSEFDQAHFQRKPTVLMLRGNVNKELMPPAMRQLYQRNARILWSEENGEYELKTTWGNGCFSILDLIK